MLTAFPYYIMSEILLPSGFLDLQLEPSSYIQGEPVGMRIKSVNRDNASMPKQLSPGKVIARLNGEDVTNKKFTDAVSSLRNSVARRIVLSTDNDKENYSYNGFAQREEAPTYTKSQQLKESLVDTRETPSKVISKLRSQQCHQDGLVHLLKGQVDKKKQLLLAAHEQSEILMSKLKSSEDEIVQYKDKISQLKLASRNTSGKMHLLQYQLQKARNSISNHKKGEIQYTSNDSDDSLRQCLLLHWNRSISLRSSIKAVHSQAGSYFSPKITSSSFPNSAKLEPLTTPALSPIEIKILGSDNKINTDHSSQDSAIFKQLEHSDRNSISTILPAATSKKSTGSKSENRKIFEDLSCLKQYSFVDDLDIATPSVNNLDVSDMNSPNVIKSLFRGLIAPSPKSTHESKAARLVSNDGPAEIIHSANARSYSTTNLPPAHPKHVRIVEYFVGVPAAQELYDDGELTNYHTLETSFATTLTKDSHATRKSMYSMKKSRVENEENVNFHFLADKCSVIDNVRSSCSSIDSVSDNSIEDRPDMSFSTLASMKIESKSQNQNIVSSKSSTLKSDSNTFVNKETSSSVPLSLLSPTSFRDQMKKFREENSRIRSDILSFRGTIQVISYKSISETL